jgi:thiol:disulfide interchange protein DsbD
VIEAARSEYFTQAPSLIDLVVATTEGSAPHGWHVRVPYAAGTAPAN